MKSVLAAISAIVFSVNSSSLEIVPNIHLSSDIVQTVEELSLIHILHKILIKTIQNPLIIGIMLGILCLIVRMLLPLNDSGQPLFMIKNNIPFLYSALQNVGKIASPLMLVVLGAQFDFGAAAQLLKQIILGTSLRLVVSPLLGIGIAVLLKDFLNLTTLEMPALIAMFSTPVAVSSVVMTEQSGGDGQLAAQLVVWTSICLLYTSRCV